MFEQSAGGVFVVRYRKADDLLPERQAALVAAVREAARAGRVGIVFDVGPEVSWVDVSVPTFWLRTTGDASLRLGAMGIVTRSMAVEIAASGFAAANAIRRTGLQVRTFPTERPAVDWVASVVSPAPATA